MFAVSATTWARFKAPAGSSYAKLAEIAEMAVELPSVCHQCSDEIEISEIEELCEIVDHTAGEVVEPPELEPRPRADMCQLPIATDEALERDRLIMGTAYSYRCACGQTHRLAPEAVTMHVGPSADLRRRSQTERCAYYDGLRAGIATYRWRSGAVDYVGDSARPVPLDEALALADAMEETSGDLPSGEIEG